MQYKKTEHEVSWRYALDRLVKQEEVMWADGLFWRISGEGHLEYSDGTKYDEWEDSTKNFLELSLMNWCKVMEVLDI